MSFESPDFVLWEWKYAWKKLLGGDYCSIPVKRLHLFFYPTLRFFWFWLFGFFLFRTSWVFFQHCKEIASLVTRVMLFRDMKNLRWTKNYRISCNCNTWKKMKTWSEDLSSPAQQLVTPGSSTAFRPCLLPPCCPWDKQLSGHADALLLATWVQIFPSHSSWCAYNSTGSA